MSKQRCTQTKVTRRQALRVCLVPAGLAATSWLVACGEKGEGPAGSPHDFDAGTAPGGGGGAGTASTADGEAALIGEAGAPNGTNATRVDAGANVTHDASSGENTPGALDASGDAGQAIADSGSAAPLDAAIGNVPWATGGTKSMQGNYPDPFTAGAMGARCMLYPEQTIGPCYADMPPTREDISEGMTGLPLRLSFLVVRADGCTPVPNASIDIWHSGSNGIYSAFETNTICNPETENVLDKRYCRGVQLTGADGKAHFSTIFPGWYTGRALHIHFTVRLNGREAITSQLYFDEKLNDEILAQGEYAKRGPRDTRASDDLIFVLSGSDPAAVTFSTAKRADGALHAWKVLSIA
jgi:protocatechuate 3,4-dioxygenase beta subunit